MTTDADSFVKAALDDILGGTPPQEAVEEAQPAAAPAVEPPPAQAKTVEPAVEDAAAAKSDLVKRALDRISERERRVAEKERELERGQPQRKWNKASIRANFSEYIKSELGLEPGNVARALMAEALGDKAPVEYQTLNQRLKDEGTRDELMDELRGEISSLKVRLEGRDQVDTAAKYQAEYQRELDTHLGGDLAQYPTVTRLLQEDRDWTVGAMWNIVRADAQAKMDAHKRGSPLAAPITPGEVIKALEAEAATLARRLGTTAPAPAKPQELNQTKEGRKTLTAVAPSKPTLAADQDDLDAKTKEALHWFNSL